MNEEKQSVKPMVNHCLLVEEVHEPIDKREERRLLSIGWPPALLKATVDPFEYALKLKSGEYWAFESASYVSDEWVRLHFSNYLKRDRWPSPPAEFPRGLEVRLKDIVWVADAPFDS